MKDVKKTLEQLNLITVDKDELNKILYERLNFAFDSLYFRYASAIDELTKYKEQEYMKSGKDPESARRKSECQKMHFYEVLEQILEAHSKDNPLKKKEGKKPLWN